MEISLAMVVLAGSIYWSWTFFSRNNLPPIKYLSVAVLTRSIYPGDTLIFRTTSDRREECFGKVDRFFIKMTNDGENLAYHDQVDTTPARVGEGVNVTFKIKTSEDLEPGNYVYRAIVNIPATCTGRPWRIEVPEASFRVCAVGDISCKD